MYPESRAITEARAALRGNIKRLAALRRDGLRVPYREVWPERQLLFSLVHGMVCATSGYSPMGDMQLQWANWFLDWCERPKEAGSFLHEEAALMLILEVAFEQKGRDLACGQ
jgi:hypothetical protein